MQEQIVAAHKAELAAIAQRDLEREKLAEMGRAVVKKIQEQERVANEYYRKWQAEVHKITDNKPCLNAASSRVWNQGLAGEGDLPDSTTRTPETSAATDTAVLGNALENFKGYSECRRQLNALIDWYESTK